MNDYINLHVLLCGCPNRPHDRSCPSVRPSVCTVRAQLENKRRSKTHENVPRAGVTRCANLQFKMSKVSVRIEVTQL